MAIYLTAHHARNQGNAVVSTLQETSRIITLWLAFAAAADVVITVALTMLLLSARRRSHFICTNTRLQNLIKYTVETGFITSCVVLIVTILFPTLPDSQYYYMLRVPHDPDQCLQYAHCTLQILLTRKVVRQYPDGYTQCANHLCHLGPSRQIGQRAHAEGSDK
ncbi:hypothetical protein BDV98DRAFT_94336 [Pterulicium gracile]|uniref:DUF6534 domain-containing protein n=1 Tax=Pterulicium gracile TaxID=1884261 RepID=A0A5C3QJW9_9AGAR|nr:hypothetical protein BDV98DRAFT_94336 [Pterula gracilis]